MTYLWLRLLATCFFFGLISLWIAGSIKDAKGFVDHWAGLHAALLLLLVFFVSAIGVVVSTLMIVWS